MSACTCDAIGEGPCPAHARENALQNEVLALREQVKALYMVAGPLYGHGRSEGWADVCAELRAILDPDDVQHWNKDGLIQEVARLFVLSQK